jgi:hypothetical protein
MLPSLWVYFADATFKQYRLTDDRQNILFSTRDYALDGDFTIEGSILTLHRDHKYQDSMGLADYDSTHDIELGTLASNASIHDRTRGLTTLSRIGQCNSDERHGCLTGATPLRSSRFSLDQRPPRKA